MEKDEENKGTIDKSLNVYEKTTTTKIVFTVIGLLIILIIMIFSFYFSSSNFQKIVENSLQKCILEKKVESKAIDYKTATEILEKLGELKTVINSMEDKVAQSTVTSKVRIGMNEYLDAFEMTVYANNKYKINENSKVKIENIELGGNNQSALFKVRYVDTKKADTIDNGIPQIYISPQSAMWLGADGYSIKQLGYINAAITVSAE